MQSNAKTKLFHQLHHLVHLEKWGILPALHLALDEFLIFDCDLMVEKTLSEEQSSQSVPIKEACSSLRLSHEDRRDAACFTLSLSSCEGLDEKIDLPKIVKERSLFELYWPNRKLSNFFKKRNKLFHAYQRRYKSAPYIAYGGLSEWIYVTQGNLTVTVIEPTAGNRLRLDSVYDSEDFEPEPDTWKKIALKECQFLVIPSGFISTRVANRLTFAYGGEMLHTDDIATQLKVFQEDVIRTYGLHSLDRDSEIRHLYWFFAVHYLDTKVELRNQDTADILRPHLAEWHRYMRLTENKSTAKHPFMMPPIIYAPPTIQTSLIVDDLRRKQPRKSLKGVKNPIDSNTSQTSVDDQPNGS